MTTDHHDITVHVMSVDHHGRAVFYASLPCSTEMTQGHRTNRSVEKHRLVSRLWEQLLTMENPVWECFHSHREATFPIHVVYGPFGRPHLLLGACRGPAISFCESGESVWAALSGGPPDIGIDVAGAEEFQKGYPFHRVFNDPELQQALSLTGGDLASAAALLWSIKEAVVKALGCGFHLVDPLQLSVYPSVAGGNSGYAFPVRLLSKALMRFPTGIGRSIRVRSFPLKKRWLSIARLTLQQDIDP